MSDVGDAEQPNLDEQAGLPASLPGNPLLRDGMWADVPIQEHPSREKERLGRNERTAGYPNEPDWIPAGNVVGGAAKMEKIHGTADFLPAWWLRVGVERAKAVFKITTRTSAGSFVGTGFLIAKNVIMTNQHVLDSEQTAKYASGQFFYEDLPPPNANIPTADSIHIKFDPDRGFVSSPWAGVGTRLEKGLDYAICAISDETADELAKAGVQPIPFPLIKGDDTLKKGDGVNIIQHPAGRTKEIVVHENKVVALFDRGVQYETDTEGGSSGSPVFDDDWDLVALHHAGWFTNATKTQAQNEGVLISAIVKDLQQKPDLAETLVKGLFGTE